MPFNIALNKPNNKLQLKIVISGIMIDHQKKEIRKQIRELKQKYSLEEKKRKSKLVFGQIENLKEFNESKTILAYWSMNDEVFTHDFIQKWYGKKEIILPSVNGNDLELKKFDGIENMKKGESFGIDEPNGEIFNRPNEIDLMIIPGVAFDKSNNRLGRGKAYYDKLLKSSNAYKIGICFDFQFFDTIPVDAHDVKMNLVISG